MAANPIHCDITDARITSPNQNGDLLRLTIRVTGMGLDFTDTLFHPVPADFAADRLVAGCNIPVEDLRG